MYKSDQQGTGANVLEKVSIGQISKALERDNVLEEVSRASKWWILLIVRKMPYQYIL
jgi:hypothetical protein